MSERATDSPNILETIDNDKIYILGGIVDRNRYKNITYEKALEQKIETARFPLQQYCTINSGTHILTVNHCYDILLSRYNSDNWMVECYFCKSCERLETHHINWKKDCNNNLVTDKPHIKMNANYNLLTVCQSCHDKIDRGEIHVDGFIQTSSGKKLKFKEKEKSKKNKFNNDQINYIIKYKDKLTLKQTKKKVKKKFDIKISTTTIEKIWKNKY